MDDDFLSQIPIDPFSICEIDTSWIGARIIIHPNGDNLFFTEAFDSVIIKTLANLNDTWALFRFSNGNFYEATVTSFALDSVLGIPDSVKEVSLQLRDSLYNPLASILNGNRFAFSKTFGLIRTLSLRHFPNVAQDYFLSGINNPILGIQNLTASGIFDFNVGDVFQYYNEFSTLNTYQKWNIQHTILGKSFSPNNDSVIYIVDDSTWQEISWMGMSYYLVHTVDTEIHALHSIYENTFDVLPRQLGQNYSYPFCFSEQKSLSNYNNRIPKTILSGFSPPSFPPYNCYSFSFSQVIDIYCVSVLETYVEGLGKVLWENVNPYAQRICIWHMNYFRKGAEMWGTPVNLSQLVNAGENTKQQINISPNPFAEILKITNLPKPATQIFLYDETGRILLNKKIDDQVEVTLNTAGFSSGIYFVSVENESGSTHFKLVRQ